MNSGKELNRPLTAVLVVLMLVIPVGFYFFNGDIQARGKPVDVERIQASFDPSEITFTRESLLPDPEFVQLFANLRLLQSA
eukprot:COSAG01_NODE_32799_length_575_cov_0.802521_1_plen_80_part_10